MSWASWLFSSRVIMDMRGKDRMESKNFAWLFAMVIAFFTTTVSAKPEVSIQGFGWVQTGMIGNATDTLRFNYNHNWMQTAATQITANVIIDEHWGGSLGIGAGQEHPMQGSTQDARLLKVNIATYITQANFTYTLGEREHAKFSATFGYFPYNYHSDIKNLGLYLLRGPVYPGALVSGFETKETLPISNFLGTRLHSSLGSTEHDLILSSETENKPIFDYSLAYIFSQSFGETFKYGGGVNFYHLLPVYDWVTNPRDPNLFTFVDSADIVDPIDRTYFYVDPTNRTDTTWLSSQGTKVDAFFRFDPKPLFESSAFGKNDLVLYGEIGLIGVKNYKGIYNDRSQRMPVMGGINLPAFGFLDDLSFEVEYYASPYKNDLTELQTNLSPTPVSNRTNKFRPKTLDSGYVMMSGDTLRTARVVVSQTGGKVFESVLWDDPYDVSNLHKDDWKWSLHLSKTVMDHIRFSAQVANDHFRPVGTGTTPTYFSIFSTMKDWYWMSKVTYFF
jgi:hypothetical protein